MAKQPALPTTPPKGAPAPASYEEALAERETLVGAMERGEMPLDRLLVETDCPYLGEEPGARNEPAAVARTAAYAAEVWSVSSDIAAAQLATNFEQLFGTPP